jgi:uncharacterized protein HemX
MTYTTLPPFPPVPPEVEPEAPPAPTKPALVAIAMFVAVVIAVAGVGWGYTQWSSARSWKHRSTVTEANFAKLTARTTRAEGVASRNERLAAKTRASLTASQTRVAELANQIAITRDLRVLICEAVPDLVDPSLRSAICQ